MELQAITPAVKRERESEAEVRTHHKMIRLDNGKEAVDLTEDD